VSCLLSNAAPLTGPASCAALLHLSPSCIPATLARGPAVFVLIAWMRPFPVLSHRPHDGIIRQKTGRPFESKMCGAVLAGTVLTHMPLRYSYIAYVDIVGVTRCMNLALFASGPVPCVHSVCKNHTSRAVSGATHRPGYASNVPFTVFITLRQPELPDSCHVPKPHLPAALCL